ncbi:hypothetical protein BF49_3629 [Bradyrhizobium sp.]|uniref:SGNH/GDSL hydrolase family protein n=1 Tax=Bradyrhizobium sp. TaxID=376 RepID=UPI0007C1DB5F|nr:SGNH/GDSL hydrolase family protein [Bradyrhizobium sp.]CUT12549.1 hypothetical protein BF49_3629 [Bradyrhizobium sp.]
MTNRTASLKMLRTANPVLPPRFLTASVMGTPPTVAMSAANTNSLSAGRYWPAVTAQNNVGANTAVYGPFTYAGAASPLQQTTYAGCLFFSNVSYGGTTNFGGGATGRKFNHATIAFYYFGSQFNIAMVGNGVQSKFALKIDDQYVSLTPASVPTSANFYYYNVSFAAPGWHRVEIIIDQNFLFNGIWTGVTDSVMPCAVRGPRVLYVADSFGEGSGAIFPGSAIAQRVFENLGWNNYICSGVGGTGLLATFGTSTKYRDRFATDVLPYVPDVVVLQGSTNDSAGGFTPMQMSNECTAIIEALKSALPNVVPIITSQAAVNGPTGTTNLTWLHRAAMKTATLAAGGFFIDLLERPLPPFYTPLTHVLASSPTVGVSSFTVSGTVPPAIGATYAFGDATRCLFKTVSGSAAPYTVTVENGGLQTAQTAGGVMTQAGDCPWSGTGRVGATTGDGNSDVLVSNDHVHPAQTGHDMIAQIIAEGIQGVLQAA